MQPAAIVLVSVFAAAATAVGTSLLLRPNEAVTPPASDDLRQELAALRAQHVELTRRLDSMGNAPMTASAAPGEARTALTVSDEQVAAAVEAWLQRHPGGVAAVAANADAAAAPFDLAREVPKLAGKNYWNNTEAWKRAFAAGQMDAVVAEFERLAKENPNDITTQMSLANAYMAYLQMDQSKWQYSMKADGVFDKVLSLDPTHWESRFTKAVSYTFYPDFLGKKKDAIKHFETLVQQQDTMPVDASQAQTYLYLGNLLEERDPARAREIWAKGARRHPDNAELLKKAGS
ncbi:MAG: hypothetical protein IT455_12110 [Planctomycetes bacterium]|nr:hypothetical protein [Planctomycetota bacterium]